MFKKIATIAIGTSVGFAMVAFCGAAQAQKTVAQVAKFSATTVQLNTTKIGIPVTGTFIVTNIGTTPLIIENVQPSSGSVKSDYTKEPIAAHKTGTITATYNAQTEGKYEKSVYVKFAGVNSQIALNIVGTIGEPGY